MGAQIEAVINGSLNVVHTDERLTVIGRVYSESFVIADRDVVSDPQHTVLLIHIWNLPIIIRGFRHHALTAVLVAKVIVTCLGGFQTIWGIDAVRRSKVPSTTFRLKRKGYKIHLKRKVFVGINISWALKICKGLRPLRF